MKLNEFQLLNFGERLNLALSALSNLPDDLEIDDDVALAVQHAIAPLESYANRTPAEHIQSVSQSIAQDSAQLNEYASQSTTPPARLAALLNLPNVRPTS